MEHCSIMDNIELVHKCKSARDSHCNNHIKRGHNSIRMDINKKLAIESEEGQTEDEEIVSQVVQTADDLYSKEALHTLLDLEDMNDDHNCNVFDFQCNHSNISGIVEGVTETTDWESTWKFFYKTCKSEWKEQQKAHNKTSLIHQDLNNVTSICHLPIPNIQNDQFMTDSTNSITIFHPNLKHTKETIDFFVAKWSLNNEQAMAFQIIANQASSPGQSPLKMFITGIGGTGKS